MATYQNSRYNIALPSGAGGALVHIKTLTASSSATLSFVDGSSDVVLDNTYRTYIFKFINIHPATDDVKFSFQANAAGGSGYNETITSTSFGAGHIENDSATFLQYEASGDQAQGTSFEKLTSNSSLGADNDQTFTGTLYLFNPSSTTFVKHFTSNINFVSSSDYSVNDFNAGYFNTTSAIDEIQFKMSDGDIDAGTIKLYGLKDS